jgi:hypothetical protein
MNKTDFHDAFNSWFRNGKKLDTLNSIQHTIMVTYNEALDKADGQCILDIAHHLDNAFQVAKRIKP